MAKKKRLKESRVNNENIVSNEPKKDQSPKVFQRDKINWELIIAERNDFSEKQKELINIINNKNTKVVFISGPSGVSKTYLAVYCGLHLLNQKHVSDLSYVRSIIESASKSLGSLPGDQEEKLLPFLSPLMDKMEELLPKCDIDKLLKEERVQGLPVNFLRGSSMNAKYVIVDEAQNMEFKELTTAITRIGRYSKFIFLGDPNQADIGNKSGFIKMFDLFNTEIARNEGIHCFSFTKDDIVRSGILKFIVDTIENYHIQHSNVKSEPMFPPK